MTSLPGSGGRQRDRKPEARAEGKLGPDLEPGRPGGESRWVPGQKRLEVGDPSAGPAGVRGSGPVRPGGGLVKENRARTEEKEKQRGERGWEAERLAGGLAARR